MTKYRSQIGLQFGAWIGIRWPYTGRHLRIRRPWLRPRGFPSPFFFPFFDGGFIRAQFSVAVDEGPAETPETTDAEAAETRRRYRAPEPATAPVAETASSALPTMRNLFCATGWHGIFCRGVLLGKGTLHYITSQGLPRTITKDTLDLDATRQFNEQRGLSFRLPGVKAIFSAGSGMT